ncbi:MAG: DUF4097 family beta strand repeat-containing protein [Chloroflexota bacterium]
MASRTRIACLALAVLLAGILAGCAVNGSITATEQERRTFPVTPGTLIVVETFNGRIGVQGRNDPVVEVRITRRGSGTSEAEAQRDLGNVRIEAEEAPGRLTLSARRVDPRQVGTSGADLELLVPVDVSVVLRSSHGRLEVANGGGSGVVRTSNAAVTTRGGTDLDLDTTNGAIAMNGPSGRLIVRASNGAVDIADAHDATVSATTSNARMTFSGTLAAGRHAFTTTNGDLSLAFPGDAAVAIDGQTTNGPVRTDFATLDVGETGLAGETARGADATVIARTTNGTLEGMARRP